MASSDNHQQAVAFAEIAARYCAWCEGPVGDELDDMRAASALLAGLHMVVFLPDSTGDGDGLNDVSADERSAVRERFDCLPVRGYHFLADPAGGPGESAFADLPDDLADIYTDVKNGLKLFGAGFADDAVWQWKSTYLNVWGRNLLEAEKCVYVWLQRNGG